MKKFALILPILLLADAAFACTPLRPFPNTMDSVNMLNSKQSLILTSSNKHFFLKLVPSKWALEKEKLVKKRDAYGLAFEAMPDGQIKQLWGFKHWDKIKSNSGLYLSNNGLGLVAINDSVTSNRDKSAVVTYYKGKVGRTYSPHDLGVGIPIRKSTCGTGSWFNFNETRGLSLYTVNNQRWTVSLDTLSVVRSK